MSVLIYKICCPISYDIKFARQKVDGWDAWGNEIKSDITL